MRTGGRQGVCEGERGRGKEIDKGKGKAMTNVCERRWRANEIKVRVKEGFLYKKRNSVVV